MNTLRVLIVDDMPQVRRELRSILPLAAEDFGTSIEIVGEAGDGQAAVEQVLALQPDVVLMDLEMPGMDGFKATQNIKVLSPRIAIVALTVHGDEVSRKKAVEAGVDLFIEKGVPVTEIIQAIQIFENKKD